MHRPSDTTESPNHASPGERFGLSYLVISSLMALIMLVSFPPITAVHGGQHYLRGLTFSALYKDGTLPVSIIRFIRISKPADATDKAFPYNLSKNAAALELNETRRIRYKSSWNVTVYPVTNYIPHIIAGTIGYYLDLRPAVICYMVKALCMLFGIGAGYFILRLLPCFHVPAMIILLLPSSWLLRASQYPDSVMNMASLLFYALIIRTIYLKHRIGWGYTVVLTVTGVVLSITKVVYFPLVAGALILKPWQFDSARHRLLSLGCIFGISLIFTLLWTVIAFRDCYGIDFPALAAQHIQNHTIEAFMEDDPARAAASTPLPAGKTSKSAYQAVNLFFAEPAQVLQRIWDHYAGMSYWKSQGGIHNLFVWQRGIRLHHFLNSLDRPVLLLLGLLPVALAVFPERSPQGNKGHRTLISWNQRVLLLCAVILTATLVAMSMYINHFHPERSLIIGLQGRYLVPLLPPFMLIGSLYVSGKQIKSVLAAQLTISGIMLAIMYYFSVLTFW